MKKTISRKLQLAPIPEEFEDQGVRVESPCEKLPTGEVHAYPRRSLGVVKPSDLSLRFLKRYYPGVSRFDWNDWQWQVRNRLRSLDDLSRLFSLSTAEISALTRTRDSLPVGITPYYASLIAPADSGQPIRRTVIPTEDEFLVSPEEASDPLGEDSASPVPGIVHRYPDRVLFLVSGFCPVSCRYCTRSRVVGNFGDYHFSKRNWEAALHYIQAHTEVRDVLLSGGDPLLLSDDRLEWLISRLRQIKHVELVRIGTKIPVVLPQRITTQFTRMLRRYHPLWISIHFTHPDELTSETAEACARLADSGIPLGSQTVLLSGINDDIETMRRLMLGLLKIRVKPYYLYQCDPISGSKHFRTTIAKGLEIIEGLRGHTTGYAVPHYVIDAPGGGGKIPLLPDYLEGFDEQAIILRNYEGRLFRYPDAK